LQAQFLAATPAFTTMRPINFDSTNAAFTGDSGLNTTQTQDAVGDKKTTFYTVRQYDSTSYDVKTYKLTVPSSAGDLTLPALGGSLTLSGRDSKIHVVDYQAGNTTILYSTGEIFTWYVSSVCLAFSDAISTSVGSPWMEKMLFLSMAA
jgi:hypothetical protein